MPLLEDPSRVIARSTYYSPKGDIFVYKTGELLLSAQVILVDGSYVSVWWVSRWYGGGSQVQVAASVTLPVYGENLHTAQGILKHMVEDVARLATYSGGMGSAADWERPESDHIEAHLEYYMSQSSGLSMLGRTAFLYGILKEFRAYNPGHVLSKIEGVTSVRTIHDRIARARDEGLLPVGRE